MKILVALMCAMLILSGCDSGSETSKIKRVSGESTQPENIIFSDDSITSIVKKYASLYVAIGRKLQDISVSDINIKNKVICKTGECAVAWLDISNARIPAVVQLINNHWFIDGISVNKEGKTFQPIPHSVIRNVIETDSIQTGKIKLPMEFYKMDGNSKGPRAVLFCDPGIQYCSDSMRVLAGESAIHLFFIPVGITPWANEASALILGSPVNLRKSVFLFLSTAKDVSADMLRVHLEKSKGITLTNSLLKQSRERVKNGNAGSKSYGITKAPVIITPSGDVLMGALKDDVLRTYLRKAHRLSSVHFSEALKSGIEKNSDAAKLSTFHGLDKSRNTEHQKMEE